MKVKTAGVALLLGVAIAGATGNQKAEASTWNERTVEDIQQGVTLADGQKTYTIVSGDTLHTIAQAMDTTVSHIVETHPIQNKNVILPGNTITIGSAQEAKPASSKQATVSLSEEQSEPKEPKAEPSSSKQAIGSFQATAYAVGAWGVPGTVTADGTDISNTIYGPDGHRIIATDPNVIPLGTTVEVVLPNGETFLATSRDTGGMIKGNIIDLLVSSPSEGLQFGRQNGIQINKIN